VHLWAVNKTAGDTSADHFTVSALKCAKEVLVKDTGITGAGVDPCELVCATVSVVNGLHGDSRDIQSNPLLARNHALFSISQLPCQPSYWLLDIPLCVQTLFKICCVKSLDTSLCGLALSILYAIERLSMDAFEDRPSTFSRLKTPSVKDRFETPEEDDPLKMRTSEKNEGSGDGDGNGGGVVSGGEDGENDPDMDQSVPRQGVERRRGKFGSAVDIGAVLASQRIPFLRSRVLRVLSVLYQASVEVSLALDPMTSLDTTSMSEADVESFKNESLFSLPIDTEKIISKLRLWSCLHLVILSSFSMLGEEVSHMWRKHVHELKRVIRLGRVCVSVMRAATLFNNETSITNTPGPTDIEKCSLVLMSTLLQLEADAISQFHSTNMSNQSEWNMKIQMMLISNLSTISQIASFLVTESHPSSSSEPLEGDVSLKHAPEQCPVCFEEINFMTSPTITSTEGMQSSQPEHVERHAQSSDGIDIESSCCSVCHIVSSRCALTLLILDVDKSMLQCRLCGAARHVPVYGVHESGSHDDFLEKDRGTFGWVYGYDNTPCCPYCSVLMFPCL